MTKLQFFLVTGLVTSVLFLLIGDRNTNSIFPIALIIALSSLANRYISESLWDKLAIWFNKTTGRRIFRVKLKGLPPSKSRRIR